MRFRKVAWLARSGSWKAGRPAIVALAVPVEQADPYGDMMTVDTGHLQHWSRLARRGAAALRAAGLPIAPVWSEYEEWPRGRVLYDCLTRCFVIRADQQLHHLVFLYLIADCFRIELAATKLLSDDHYRSVRQVLAP